VVSHFTTLERNTQMITALIILTATLIGFLIGKKSKTDVTEYQRIYDLRRALIAINRLELQNDTEYILTVKKISREALQTDYNKE
jgi:hypothetical protein